MDLQQKISLLGNTSNAEREAAQSIIDAFKKNEITGKEAYEKTYKILYSKEAGIDANSGDH